MVVTVAVLLVFVWGAGLATAWRVLHERRSPEGTIAWAFALICLPFFAVPIYWGLGSSRDMDYRTALIEATGRTRGREPFADLQGDFPSQAAEALPTLAGLSPFPFLGGNRIELFREGASALGAIESALATARHYILVQCYAIANDQTGGRFLSWLAAAARRGVRVFVLYDAWGSYRLDRAGVSALREAGVEALPFRFGRRGIARSKLNFRNHRKIIVVDGQVAFFGGLNVADLYLGLKPRLSPWRDTHVRLEGPAALMFQSVFATDWHLTSGTFVRHLNWRKAQACGEAECTLVPTGPVEAGDCALMLFHSLVRRAEKRLWISSPYLITNDAVLAHLRAAVLRGVDVRILTTGLRDHYTTFWAGLFFARELRDAGIKVLRYGKGFLHQKAILVDDRVAALGSMNLDNRSLFLNFEITALFADRPTISAVESVLSEDFKHSLETSGEWDALSAPKRFLACVARLFGPLL